LLTYLSLLAYLVGLLISVEGAIRKYPEGQRLIGELSNGTLTFMAWRARADARREMRGLSAFFGWTAFAFGAAFFFAAPFTAEGLQLNLSLAAVAMCGIWLCFQWFLDPRRQLREFLPVAVVAVLFPWLPAMGVPFDPLSAVREELVRAGWTAFTPNIFAIAVSIVGLIGCTLVVLLSYLLFRAVAWAIFFLLKLSTFLSRRWLTRSPRWLYYVFLGYFVIATMYYLLKSEVLGVTP
jgi:hypothetical protein